MGAWGSGSFENDDACDWLGELADTGVDAVVGALTAAAEAEPDEYLEAPECSMAIAAAEVVAAARGSEAGALPDEAREWLAAEAGSLADGVAALARRALERILAGSELKELWDEHGPDNPWQATMRDLLARLR